MGVRGRLLLQQRHREWPESGQPQLLDDLKDRDGIRLPTAERGGKRQPEQARLLHLGPRSAGIVRFVSPSPRARNSGARASARPNTSCLSHGPVALTKSPGPGCGCSSLQLAKADSPVSGQVRKSQMSRLTSQVAEACSWGRLSSSTRHRRCGGFRRNGCRSSSKSCRAR